MIDKDLEMESGKMLTLMQLVRDITSEGYKVLVFSQFVKMLQLVKQELHKEAIEYAYLDGQTRNREAVINKFQKDERYKVFLISIKAGGLGLNLTAAEYVIQIFPNDSKDLAGRFPPRRLSPDRVRRPGRSLSPGRPPGSPPGYDRRGPGRSRPRTPRG